MAVSAAETTGHGPSVQAAANLPAGNAQGVQARQNQYHTMPEKVAQERAPANYIGDVPTFIQLARSLTMGEAAPEQQASDDDNQDNLAAFRTLGRRLEAQGTRVDKILGTTPAARDLLALIRSHDDSDAAAARAFAAEVLPDQTDSEAKSLASVQQAQSERRRRAMQAPSALGAQVLKDQSTSQDDSAASALAEARAFGADVLPDQSESEAKSLASVQQARAFGADVLPDDTAEEDKSLASVQQARAFGADVLPDQSNDEAKSLASVQQARAFGADVLPDDTAEEDKSLASVQQARAFGADVLPDQSESEAKSLASVQQARAFGADVLPDDTAEEDKSLASVQQAERRGVAPIVAPQALPHVHGNKIKLGNLVHVDVAGGHRRGLTPKVAPQALPHVHNNKVDLTKLVSIGVAGRGVTPKIAPQVLPAVHKNGVDLKNIAKVTVAGGKRGIAPAVLPKIAPIVHDNGAKASKLININLAGGKRDASEAEAAPAAAPEAAEPEATKKKPAPKKTTPKKKPAPAAPIVQGAAGLKFKANLPVTLNKKPLAVQVGGKPTVYQPSLVNILGRADTNANAVPDSVAVGAAGAQSHDAAHPAPDAAVGAAANDNEASMEQEHEQTKRAQQPPLAKLGGAVKVSGLPIFKDDKKAPANLKGAIKGVVSQPSLVKIVSGGKKRLDASDY
ncbi:hypothetical protein OC834_006671 [Tilletia horrida]|nr:hypothetical protein OC834_006671 [Tilletia horrida]